MRIEICNNNNNSSSSNIKKILQEKDLALIHNYVLFI
jgi:hypothetical protein